MIERRDETCIMSLFETSGCKKYSTDEQHDSQKVAMSTDVKMFEKS